MTTSPFIYRQRVTREKGRGAQLRCCPADAESDAETHLDLHGPFHSKHGRRHKTVPASVRDHGDIVLCVCLRNPVVVMQTVLKKCRSGAKILRVGSWIDPAFVFKAASTFALPC